MTRTASRACADAEDRLRFRQIPPIANPSLSITQAHAILVNMDKRDAGQHGGRSRSLAKQTASRRNGVLGGRPTRAKALLCAMRRLYEHLHGKCPEIDPGDLSLIVERMCRRPGSGRRFFIRPLEGGGFGV